MEFMVTPKVLRFEVDKNKQKLTVESKNDRPPNSVNIKSLPSWLSGKVSLDDKSLWKIECEIHRNELAKKYKNCLEVKEEMINVETIGKKSITGKEIRDLVIYPGEKEKRFEKPFFQNYLMLKEFLSHNRICIVVGYSFRDIEITQVFHEAFEKNDSLKVIIIDPNADKIANKLFKTQVETERIFILSNKLEDKNVIDEISNYLDKNWMKQEG